MQKPHEVSELRYLKSAEAMSALKISRRTLDRWVTDGKLPASRIAGTGNRRYLQADIDALLRGEQVNTQALAAIDLGSAAHTSVPGASSTVPGAGPASPDGRTWPAS